MHRRMTKFLNLTNQLYEQFGPTHEFSTTPALLKITEKIRQSCDTGKYLCAVFLDLQKTFDTVSNTIFLNKYFNSFLKGQKTLG